MFKTWLEATSIRPLYHGTMTGTNDATLQSFKANGVRPHSATGYGQGTGFFVFADFDTAAKHALVLQKRAGRENDQEFTTSADTAGKPMVVQITANIHPEDYEIDFELNSQSVIKFLHDNAEKLQGLQFSDEDGQFSLGRAFKRGGYHGMTFAGRGTVTDNPDSDTGRAQTLNSIWQALRQHNPNTVNAFKTAFFDNMTPGIAIKYIGDRPLPVAKVVVFEYGHWTPA